MSDSKTQLIPIYSEVIRTQLHLAQSNQEEHSLTLDVDF
jgi:hypothetical protein